jgi:hypothetical protein
LGIVSRTNHGTYRFLFSCSLDSTHSPPLQLPPQVIAHKSSTEEILELRKAFDQYDCGHDGVITFEEFKSGLKKVNYDDDDMHEIFDSIDINQNGYM